MDLSDLVQVRRVIRAECPQVIINCAAYTAVDKAESQPEQAYLINALAPAVIAEEALSLGAALIHFSTDYVYDGRKRGAYVESDSTNPINRYGASKLAGERAIAATGVKHLILRCSWIYSMQGSNFLRAILHLAKTGQAVRVVADQYGAPTWNATVANVTALILRQAWAGGPTWWDTNGGIYHLCSQGYTSWHGFAQEILACAGLPSVVQAISSEDYAAPAQRPVNSVMSTDKLTSRFCATPDWRLALSQCFESAG